MSMLQNHQVNILVVDPDSGSRTQTHEILISDGYACGLAMAEMLHERMSGASHPMSSLTLSPEQENAIRSNAAAAFQAAQQRHEPNPMAAGFLDLESWVEQQVLSPQQHTAYQDVKKANPMRSLQW